MAEQAIPRQRTVVLEDDALRSLGGFTQIPNFILKHPKLSFGAKVTFGVLLSYAWQDDFCFPAQQKLADDISCTVRQAQRLLIELRAAGFLRWKQQGLNRPNIYYLLSRKEHPTPPAKSGPGRRGRPTKSASPDTTNLSPPEATFLTPLEATNLSYKEDSRKKTQNTHGVRAKTSGKGEDNKAAIDLVSYFHEKIGGSAGRQPTPRELSQASAILAEHGGARARFIVDYAVQKAEETRFRMRHFGALQSYVSEGALAFEGAEKARRRREADQRKQRDEDQRREAERADWQQLSPEERVERRVQTNLITFRIVKGREPMDADVEELRRKFSEQEGITHSAARRAG